MIKKIISLALLSSMLLVGCGAKEEGPTAEKNDTVEKFTGTVVGEELYDATGKKGDVVVAKVDFKDGEVVGVNVDVRQENGSMKKEVSAAGGYVMKEGEEKAWHEQIELLENFLKDNNFDVEKVAVNDKQGTDAVSGVSIKVESYVQCIKNVIDTIKSGNPVETGFTGAKVVEIPYDSTGAKKDVVVAKVVFDHNEPVSVAVDVRLEDGTMKKKLSQDGGYVMKEGEEKAWHEQVEELEKFVVENKFDLSKVVLDDEGATDAVTGVSIKIGAYVEAIQTALDSVR